MWVRLEDGGEGSGQDDDDLLHHVAWVRLERVGVQIRSAIEAAAQRHLGYRFDMSRAPTHTGRDS
jgi:hypothetical protein